MKDFSKYSAIIIGAGDATGSALTKKFASEGYKVCPVRRSRNIDKVDQLADEITKSGGWAKGFGVDARDEDALKALFKEVDENIIEPSIESDDSKKALEDSLSLKLVDEISELSKL